MMFHTERWPWKKPQFPIRGYEERDGMDQRFRDPFQCEGNRESVRSDRHCS